MRSGRFCLSRVMTGMSPINSALQERPSAALKISEHGRVLTSAARFGVRDPEQPESACARMSTDTRADCTAGGTVEKGAELA